MANTIFNPATLINETHGPEHTVCCIVKEAKMSRWDNGQSHLTDYAQCHLILTQHEQNNLQHLENKMARKKKLSLTGRHL